MGALALFVLWSAMDRVSVFSRSRWRASGLRERDDVKNFDDLAEFRVDGDELVSPEPMEPLKAKVLGGLLIVFDQALEKTGWALYDVDRDHFVRTGLIRVGKDTKPGFLDTAKRIRGMYQEIRIVLRECGPDAVGHEMPSARQTRLKMREMAVGALSAVWIAVATYDPLIDPIMVNSQQVRTHLCGNPKATKAEVKAEVLRRYPALEVDKVGPINQDVTDACALALAIAGRI